MPGVHDDDFRLSGYNTWRLDRTQSISSINHFTQIGPYNMTDINLIQPIYTGSRFEPSTAGIYFPIHWIDPEVTVKHIYPLPEPPPHIRIFSMATGPGYSIWISLTNLNLCTYTSISATIIYMTFRPVSTYINARHTKTFQRSPTGENLPSAANVPVSVRVSASHPSLVKGE